MKPQLVMVRDPLYVPFHAIVYTVTSDFYTIPSNEVVDRWLQHTRDGYLIIMESPGLMLQRNIARVGCETRRWIVASFSKLGSAAARSCVSIDSHMLGARQKSFWQLGSHGISSGVNSAWIRSPQCISSCAFEHGLARCATGGYRFGFCDMLALISRRLRDSTRYTRRRARRSPSL